MELTINVDEPDKTNSAVVSATNRTAVAELDMLIVGNVEPLTVSFCDSDGATPSWVTDAGTVVAMGLGRQEVDGAQLYASAASLAVTGSTRTGTIDLDTVALRTAASAWTCCCHRNHNGIWVTLELRRVTTVAAVVTAAQTVALLPVFIALPVLSYA